ncbi:MAG: lipoprotein insertase outer membrane protein LolB [Methylophilaceae bacterium]
MPVTSRQLLLATFVGVLFILTGCAGIKPQNTTPLPASTPEIHAQHLATIAAISAFDLQTRIGVQANGRGFSGATNWKHSATHDNIAIFSPLGAQVATIDKTPNGVTLIADGKTYYADDTETLTQKILGWSLPMQGLPDWILGRPSSSKIEQSAWDEAGRLTKLRQDGWDIEYSQYVSTSGYQLPQKIALRSQNLNLKIIVERWLLSESHP